jgi:hypothetical protein
MGLESTLDVSFVLGGSHCHQTYSILFYGLEWAQRVKKGLLQHSWTIFITIIIISTPSTILEFTILRYFRIYTYEHLF